MRRTPLTRRTPLARAAFIRQTRARLAPHGLRARVLARYGHLCPVCLLPVTDPHLHHRKLRSQGGTWDLENVLPLHATCHGAVHANPTKSYRFGYLVHRDDDPRAVPVLAGSVLRGAA